MAGAFDAKVDISTKEAVEGLRNLRSEAKLLGQGLQELDGIIKANKQNLVLAAQQFTQLVAAQRAAASGSKELAAAQINEARAAGIVAANAERAAVATARVGRDNAAAASSEAQRALAVTRRGIAESNSATAADRAAAATSRATTATAHMNDSLSNSRYLMYDVGATYAIIATGLMAIPAATAAVAAAYQRDFAQVLRVTHDLDQMQGGAEGLKDSLKDLSVAMPIGFDELSRITQLGAQMGVANEKLAAFTETTAKFVAVTGISADAGATLFGRLETSFTNDVQEFPDFFDRVGSSIAKVGAATVATDPEIAAMMNQIGSLGASAGMNAREVVGLAAALSSVRVQPELARGTLTRIFGQLNRDVAEGSPRLASFGKLMGATAEEAGALWESDPSKFFTALIKGLNETHKGGGNLTTTLDALGIKASRDVSALTKLAVGYEVLDKSMRVANEGFEEGTSLNEMSKPVFETLLAKLTMMANAWKNVGESLGSGALGPLAAFVELATNLGSALSSLVEHVPLVGVLISTLMGFAAVTALFLSFRAAQAFVMAGMIGFQQAATRGMGAGFGMGNMMRTLAQTMLMAKGATDAQTRALLGQAGAFRALAIASATSTTAIRAAGTGAVGASAGFRGMGASLLGMVGGGLGLAVAGLALLTGHLISTAIEAEQAGKAIAEGLEQGADAGMRAVAKVLSEKKVNWQDGIFVGNAGKNVAEIAKDAGVGFESMIAAIAKGKQGVAGFKAELEALAQSKGYASLQDMSLKNPGALAGDGALRAKYEFLLQQVEHYADAQEGAKKTTDASTDALAKLGVESQTTGGILDDAGEGVDDLTSKLKELNDEIFSSINAEAALQDSLGTLGEGLAKSGSFNITDENGRANLKNLQDSLTSAQEYYNQLKETNQATAEEAAQGYADFVTGLMGEIRAVGGDSAAVEELAAATKAKFQTAIGGDPVSVPLTLDQGQAENATIETLSGLQRYVNEHVPVVQVGYNDDTAQANIIGLANALAEITGYPYEVVMDALTNPASEKANEIFQLISSITDHTYVAPVDADTTAAQQNVINFASFAQQQLNNIQSAYNSVLAMSQNGKGFFKGAANDILGKGWEGKGQQTYFPQAAPQIAQAAPAPQVKAAPKSLASPLGGLAKGYNGVRDAAKGAGDAGKQAGKDMAKGIDDATAAAEDYANRLKTGLTSAFNQQYGLTKATDEYHSALNAINKKREDELNQLADLKAALKDLNNERDKELITANKAKIEAGISAKYGETDRMIDYENQAQTALDNAAAKKKDINANIKATATLEDGIGKLDGYTDAAIANRAALRDLESKALDMIVAYAATGASTDQVRAYAAKLTAQWQRDVGQMGLNMAAVGALQGSLDRYIGVINRVPRYVQTDVNANVGGAIGGVGALSGAINNLPKVTTVEVRANTGQFIKDWWEATLRVRKGIYDGINNIPAKGPGGTGALVPISPFNAGGMIPGFNSGGLIPGTPPANPRADNMLAQVDGKGMIKVRSREYIQPQEAVDYYGMDFMNAIRTLSLPKFSQGGSTGGNGGGGSVRATQAMVVTLDADSRAAIQRSGNRPVVLYADSTKIAESANYGNTILASTGAN